MWRQIYLNEYLRHDTCTVKIMLSASGKASQRYHLYFYLCVSWGEYLYVIFLG